MKFSNLVCFIAIKHSLRITTSYLCREGGEYNTRKGNNPGRSLFRFTNLLATLLGQIFVK
nr:MAG TPA: hypothetical protein [Bacteriophage sp.]